MGRLEEAVTHWREALRIRPDFPEAHNNLGNALRSQGRLEESVAHCRQAVLIRPDFPEAHNNLGNALADLGLVAEAIACLRLAVDINPGFAAAWSNLGNLLTLQDQFDEAVRCYQQAVRLNPNSADAYFNWGLARAGHDQLDEAVRCFRQALELRPNFAEAFNNLGNALIRQAKFDEGIGCFQEALRHRPNFPEAFSNLGNALVCQNKLEEGISYYRRAIALKPDFAHAHGNLGSAFLRQGRLDEALTSFRQALRLQPDMSLVRSSLLFCSNYDPNADPDAVFAAHRAWGQTMCDVRRAMCDVKTGSSDIAHRTSHIAHNDPERPLRIGYVSPDLRFHPLTRYLEPVLAHHDPEQVEVFCYAEGRFGDAVTNRLQKLVPNWRWTSRLSDAQVAEHIRGDKIDILVDLAGHTTNNRLRVFAQKAAPIQATWLGYMNTTGLTTIDYRLTDEVLDPPGQPVRDTEELFRLPGGMCCFAPPEDAPAVTPLPALRRGHLTFGSLHGLLKLNAQVLDLWSQVLQAVPDSRLLMFHDTVVGPAQKRIRRQFVDRGIAGERLDLRQGSRAPGYLGVYEEIDVSLDTFPWTGGVTTCESLWMGVPVLSLCGVRPAGRNSAALLARVGLTDCVAQTPEQYVALALRLRDDLDRLAALRTTLRDRMGATLCDSRRFTRQLEVAYRTMWRRWCSQQHQEIPNPKPQIPNKFK